MNGVAECDSTRDGGVRERFDRLEALLAGEKPKGATKPKPEPFRMMGIAARPSTLRRVRVRGALVLVDDWHPPNISAFTFL